MSARKPIGKPIPRKAAMTTNTNMTKQDIATLRRILCELHAALEDAAQPDLDDLDAVAESGALEVFGLALAIQARASSFTGSVATEQDYRTAVAIVEQANTGSSFTERAEVGCKAAREIIEAGGAVELRRLGHEALTAVEAMRPAIERFAEIRRALHTERARLVGTGREEVEAAEMAAEFLGLYCDPLADAEFLGDDLADTAC